MIWWCCLPAACYSFFQFTDSSEGLLYSTKDSWYRAPAGTSTGCHIPLSAGCSSPSSLMMLYFAWLLNQPASEISAGCFECLIWRYFAIPPLILSASYYLLAIQLINSFFFQNWRHNYHKLLWTVQKTAHVWLVTRTGKNLYLLHIHIILLNSASHCEKQSNCPGSFF